MHVCVCVGGGGRREIKFCKILLMTPRGPEIYCIISYTQENKYEVACLSCSESKLKPSSKSGDVNPQGK